MKKALLPLLITAFVLVIAPTAKSVLAAVRCETTYGGGEVCVRTGELQIDKEVWDPKDNRFEENLYLDRKEDYIFGPSETITFLLKITNVGDETFDKVHVQDTLPKYLNLVSGELSFEINDLSPGETEERRIEAKVVSAENFPDDATICDVNAAEVWFGDERDKNTAQICMEEKVLGVTVLPPTGPSNWLPLLVSTATLGSIGFYLSKFKK